MSPSTFCEGPQKSSIIFPLPEGSGFLSGRIPFMMHTASITSFTSAGGFYVREEEGERGRRERGGGREGEREEEGERGRREQDERGKRIF